MRAARSQVFPVDNIETAGGQLLKGECPRVIVVQNLLGHEVRPKSVHAI